MRNLQFGLFLVVGAFVIAAIAAPDALFSMFTGEPTRMVTSDCPPERAKEGRASCLKGPFAGTKIDNRINDAIKNFDD